MAQPANIEELLRSKGYELNSKGEWWKPSLETRSLPPAPKHQPNTGNDSVAESARETDVPSFRVVRVTSYRTRLVDERNLWDKYLVDSLVRAQLLRDDSPQWCRVEVHQVKVGLKSDERTEVEISEERNPQTSDTGRLDPSSLRNTCPAPGWTESKGTASPPASSP